MEDMNIVLSIAVLILCAFLVIIIMIQGVRIVPNQSAYVVERLGKFYTVLGAGFHILIPFLDRVAYKRSLKEEVLDVPQQGCITKDNVSIAIDGFLYLQVINPEKSAYGIDDYKFAAVQLAQTALRSAIGTLELDRTFEERTKINQAVVEALDAAAEGWGVKVLRYELRDIVPPASVMESMEKQMKAEREKRAAIAASEGEREAKKNIAEGEKAAVIAASEAQKQALINKAEGEAATIKAIAQASAEGIALIAQQINAEGGKDAAQIRLAESYIEQFGQIAQKGTTTIVPANIADVSGVVATAMNAFAAVKK